MIKIFTLQFQCLESLSRWELENCWLLLSCWRNKKTPSRTHCLEVVKLARHGALFHSNPRLYLRPSTQAAKSAKILSKMQPTSKQPSHINVNMAESCREIPRLKRPCVLQPLHVQSSTFDRNYLYGSKYMEQVLDFWYLQHLLRNVH